ncbi:hypothetical protein FUAX_03310 [Fulvitalea axinellae]|uniref:Uncharacterized protein n=1 Tax=Fulvitalea axinellae TaxID=1182444 RepID=A0AAU9CNH6_9BACT|nr:hypothetical protein FUAX_03310 [Fulvitalea axinellae]
MKNTFTLRKIQLVAYALIFLSIASCVEKTCCAPMPEGDDVRLEITILDKDGGNMVHYTHPQQIRESWVGLYYIKNGELYDTEKTDGQRGWFSRLSPKSDNSRYSFYFRPVNSLEKKSRYLIEWSPTDRDTVDLKYKPKIESYIMIDSLWFNGKYVDEGIRLSQEFTITK